MLCSIHFFFVKQKTGYEMRISDWSSDVCSSRSLQLAGRYEHYSDFGSVARPKIAAAWDVFDGLRFRGSYSQGFRAPNLEQVNAVEYARLATSQDFLRCEVDLRAGRLGSQIGRPSWWARGGPYGLIADVAVA